MSKTLVMLRENMKIPSKDSRSCPGIELGTSRNRFYDWPQRHWSPGNQQHLTCL